MASHCSRVPPSHTLFSWLGGDSFRVPAAHTPFSWTAAARPHTVDAADAAGTAATSASASTSASAAASASASVVAGAGTGAGAGAGAQTAATPDSGGRQSLLSCAREVMLTPGTDDKAAKTLKYVEMWQAGELDVGPEDAATAPGAPDVPARPDDIKVVHATKTKSSSKKGMLHALVHAESFAIDLSWDILLRFAYAAPGGSLMPRQFFTDWCKVAKEESQHYSSWKKRLEELGSFYGDMPAHDGLWDAAAATSDSLAARLAVIHCVHEARGLDVYPNSACVSCRVCRPSDPLPFSCLRACFVRPFPTGVDWTLSDQTARKVER